MDYYRDRIERLGELESLNRLGKIDLYYGDESHVCSEGYARLHKAKTIQERIPYWQSRGLFLFYLPPYSPHLNLAETLWRKLKKEWLNPEDYSNKDTLFYATNRWLANVGHNLNINFSNFNEN